VETWKTLRVSHLPTPLSLTKTGKHQPGHKWKASAGSFRIKITATARFYEVSRIGMIWACEVVIVEASLKATAHRSTNEQRLGRCANSGEKGET
jgi:hypothetical protein